MLQPSPLSPSFTHYLPCSGGDTALSALEWLIYNDTADVVAALSSVAATYCSLGKLQVIILAAAAFEV